MKRKNVTLRNEVRWLSANPPLHELMERYPDEWQKVGGELVSLIKEGNAEKLNEFAQKARWMAEMGKERILKSGNNPNVIEAFLPNLVRSKMWLLALDKCYLSSAMGKTTGKVRFNLINGDIIQRLLFSRHLTRKPVPLFWFRFFWPFLTQKRILMPLVQTKGIYCFYSSRLIKELAALIDNRLCLEIGAGDGTLSRLLFAAGIRVTATDDYSWSHTISYPDTVERIDAREALKKYQPQVTICSWPPPNNRFERHMFTTESVSLCIVIGSRHKFASGNWETYTAQKHFDWKIDYRLSSYVIPPELDSAILIFSRKPKGLGDL
jgi:2-polyprenyl-3-methyl-5-hydroxy-6-metoxy-1,4-benzoquinol methylase